jgi:hypothetical protein
MVVVVLLVVAAALLLWGTFGSLPSVTRRATKSFWCPFHERNVTTEFAVEPWAERPFDVSSCNAFTPETAVACDKSCLRLSRLPALKGPLGMIAFTRGMRPAKS